MSWAIIMYKSEVFLQNQERKTRRPKIFGDRLKFIKKTTPLPSMHMV